jgi:hypothetical protein
MEENFLFYAVLEGKRSGFCLRGVGMIENITKTMSVFIYTIIKHIHKEVKKRAARISLLKLIPLV